MSKLDFMSTLGGSFNCCSAQDKSFSVVPRHLYKRMPSPYHMSFYVQTVTLRFCYGYQYQKTSDYSFLRLFCLRAVCMRRERERGRGERGEGGIIQKCQHTENKLSCQSYHQTLIIEECTLQIYVKLAMTTSKLDTKFCGSLKCVHWVLS